MSTPGPERSGRLSGTVALVTGAARGQGRSHAVRFAEEGADVIVLDRCADIDVVPYPLGTKEELDETARLVEEAGGQVWAGTADVRDADALSATVAAGVDRLGRLDTVVANAGVCTVQRWDEVTPEVWETVVGVNLTGTWNTCTAALPHVLATGGGSLVLVSSVAGGKGQPFFGPYSATKHGVVGIMRSLANELASQNVRVNSVHPTGVDTPMLVGMAGLAGLIGESPDTGPLFLNALPVPLVDPGDVSEAVVYLASPGARFVTGLSLAVDAGALAR